MARIPGITDRNQLEESDQPIFDEIVGSRGSVRGPFPMLLHSPEMARRVAHLGTYLRFEGGLDAHTREFSVLVTCATFNCEYEWAAHSVQARDAGVSEASIEAVRDGKPDVLSAEDRLLYDIVKETLIESATPPSAEQRRASMSRRWWSCSVLSATTHCWRAC
jgi:4-carboxymuconolactone decarboxylase